MNLWDALKQKALDDLSAKGFRVTALTRLMRMPPSWQAMHLEEDLYRLVADVVCVDPTKMGRRTRAEVVDGHVWSYHEGQVCWAVVTASAVYSGRTKPTSINGGKLVLFSSRDDAADFAGFPPKDTNGATRSTEWFDDQPQST